MNERYHSIPSPSYVMEEPLLRRNLELIRRVSAEADVEIILAFKAFALWKTFPIFREYISGTTASSLSEARLGYEEMGAQTHTYAPVYRPDEMEEILRCSSHITFNSLSQFDRWYPTVRDYAGHPISCGLRLNPEYSEIETDLYNPASPDSRLGVPLADLTDELPVGIEGIHIHSHCEDDSHTFARSLSVIEEKFGRYLERAKWVNFGGGHLMTRKDYDVELLIQLLTDFHRRYPHLRVILEPGSAFAWQTGPLITTILDRVTHGGVTTLMIDASFSCHMPDCLEMPYQPAIRGASITRDEEHTYGPYRVGGNSCLSGDVMGDWYLDHEPEVGERLIFEDMIHYTTVKTTMFNGISHPSIYLLHSDGTLELLRAYGYEDYKTRMD